MSQECIHKPQCFEEKGKSKQRIKQTLSACQPNALLPGQTTWHFGSEMQGSVCQGSHYPVISGIQSGIPAVVLFDQFSEMQHSLESAIVCVCVF